MSSATRRLRRLATLTGFSLASLAAGAAFAQSGGDRVVGGVDARQGEFPFQAYLLIDTPQGQFACGGTLIAPRWILTAGHCTQTPNGEDFPASAITARLGSIERSSGGELHHVVRIVRHQDYSAKYALENDIALLELDRSAQVHPVALDAAGAVRAEGISNPWAKVIGWGLRTGGDVSSSSEILQAAPLPLVDTARCDRTMRGKVPEAGAVDSRRLCAGQSVGGVDSCNGDSGGPLLLSEGERWRQVGIVSYGVTECGAPDSYGVYTRVGAYRDWIANQTGASSVEQSNGPVAPIQLGLAAVAPQLVDVATQNEAGIGLAVSPKSLTVGQPFRISVTAPRSGYLALFDVGPSGAVTQIFPNPRASALGKDGRVDAGHTLSIPDPSYGFEFTASEPKGRGRVIAVVAEDQREFASLFNSGEGFKALADAPQRFSRLEIVMKDAPSQDGNTAPKPPNEEQTGTSGWIAALTDYVIK